MTFADSVLHLVRAGARIDSWAGPDSTATSELQDHARHVAVDEELAIDLAAGAAEAADAVREYEPGLADLEAAVGLVSTGLAGRVVLSGFRSWPGLLWRAYQLADTAGVLILPAVVRPGGKVDIVITRDFGADV